MQLSKKIAEAGVLEKSSEIIYGIEVVRIVCATTVSGSLLFLYVSETANGSSASLERRLSIIIPF
jgi:hypothetical protein